MPQAKKIFDCLRVPERTAKPRTTGLTMVEGDIKLAVVGMNWLHDLADWGGDSIDFFKVNRHLMFQKPELVVRKLKFLKQHQIEPYLGGGITEIAVHQGCVERLWEQVRELGINVIEVSTTHLSWTVEQKVDLVHKARQSGFTVFVEIGKKHIGAPGGPKARMPISEVIQEMRACLNAGAFKLVYEYTEIVKLLEEDAGLDGLLKIADSVGAGNIMFEVPVAPWKEVSPYVSLYIKHFGANANIGDVDPSHITQIEVDRCAFWSQGSANTSPNVSKVDHK
jgi:phosphosulfolactate synthase